MFRAGGFVHSLLSRLVFLAFCPVNGCPDHDRTRESSQNSSNWRIVRPSDLAEWWWWWWILGRHGPEMNVGPRDLQRTGRSPDSRGSQPRFRNKLTPGRRSDHLKCPSQGRDTVTPPYPSKTNWPSFPPGKTYYIQSSRPSSRMLCTRARARPSSVNRQSIHQQPTAIATRCPSTLGKYVSRTQLGQSLGNLTIPANL